MSPGKTIRHSLLYLFARTFLSLARFVPRAAGLRISGAIGAAVFSFPNREKSRTIEHLRLIYGMRWPERKIIMTARAVYRELGKNLFDAIYLSGAGEAAFNRIVKCDDWERLQKAYDAGRGVVVITAHTGCYEMLLHFVARRGMRCFAIGRRMFDRRLEGLIRSVRSGKNIEYMGRDEGTLKIVRHLREGKVFGVLIDQDVRVEGIFAEFLGRPANTPSGPFKIAMKLNIPMVVITTARQPDDTHRVYIHGPMAQAVTGDVMSDLAANVQTANRLISETIERFPEQWVWMHRRWKRQPQTSQ